MNKNKEQVFHKIIKSDRKLSSVNSNFAPVDSPPHLTEQKFSCYNPIKISFLALVIVTGSASYQILARRGLTEPQFLKMGCWERESDFFQGGGEGGGGVCII